MTKNSEVLFVNHSSLLVKKEQHYLLTDPWHQKPAFGSVLPSLPSSVHPAYLAALNERLTILISHDHDDHIDDDLLQIFKKDTQILIADFKSKSLLERIKQAGFTNIQEINQDGTVLTNGVHVRAYVTKHTVHEDAIYTIDTQDGCVIHANDHWFEWPTTTLDHVRSQITNYETHQVTLFGQAHSATGYPLNTPQLDLEQKRELVLTTAQHMLKCELITAEKLGLSRYVSYAGFISPYIKNKDEYRDLIVVPTAKSLTKYIPHDDQMKQIREKVQLLEFYPGDTLDIKTGEIHKSFISSDDYSDHDAQKSTDRYYHQYNVMEQTATYKSYDNDFNEQELSSFVEKLSTFISKKVTEDSHFKSVYSMKLNLHIKDLEISRHIIAGEGVSHKEESDADILLSVNSKHLSLVTQRKMSLENLYIGFIGQWSFKESKETYNDFIDLLMIFAHQYLHNEI